MKGKARNAQLIIFEDGTLYHIALKKADNVPPNVLLVGAAGRVNQISRHFDRVDQKIVFKLKNRNKDRPEFYLVAGEYKGVPVAAMSIGIGIGPIDIAVTELHALFEYDHETGLWTKDIPKVNIIRVGTCGTSLPEIPAGTLAISEYAIGLDNLGAYYPIPPARYSSIGPLKRIEKKFIETLVGKINPLTYCSSASPYAFRKILQSAISSGEDTANIACGITTASPGFFGPEGRQIGRIRTAFSPEEFREVVQSFNVDRLRIINHEMETSILFRLGYEHLGYNVGAICLVADNIATDEVITGNEAKERMGVCIRVALEALVALSKNV